jgi:hypothetical protein
MFEIHVDCIKEFQNTAKGVSNYSISIFTGPRDAHNLSRGSRGPPPEKF